MYSMETLGSIATSIEPISAQNSLDLVGGKLEIENNSDLADPHITETSTSSLPDAESRKSLHLDSSSNMNLLNPAQSWSANMSKSDESELNAKLKHLEKDIVYLDFLFAQSGVDKIAVIIETEKMKVELALKEMANTIFKKLLSQIKGELLLI